MTQDTPAAPHAVTPAAAEAAPAGRITLEQLMEKIGDPQTPREDLAQYFRIDPEAGAPFDPAVEIDTNRVHVPDTDSARSRSALIVNSANTMERWRRQRRFYKRLSEGNYTGPIIVEEGDSWFQYPLMSWDAMDVLMERYAILSLSAGGDTLENMVRMAEYRDAIATTGATIFLISAGGNDLVAGGNLASHLRDYSPDLRPDRYLLPSFDQLIARALTQFDRIFRDVARRFPHVSIVCHGYDYPIPNAGRWLGRPMAARRIADKTVQRAIATVMMDRFNAELARLANRHRHVHYLDLRNVVKGWRDELHPDDNSCRRTAARFAQVIDRLSAAPRRAASDAMVDGPRARSAGRGGEARTQVRGVSLHVGVNAVDPAHYGEHVAPLSFCENDATAMEELARAQGFGTQTLTAERATRAGVIGAVEEVARDLHEGDIFLFTVASHGSQVPDINEDELGGPDQDRIDETLCLYDGQMIDDELFRLWSRFRQGVRIVGVFDTCHSGSVIRAPVPARQPEGGARARAVSLGASYQVYLRNRAFYDALPDARKRGPDEAVLARELDFPLAATVLQLSACQSNQEAMESLGNGHFTRSLLDAYAAPASRYGYSGFVDRVASRMSAAQTPKFWRLGPRNDVFEASAVFSL